MWRSKLIHACRAYWLLAKQAAEFDPKLMESDINHSFNKLMFRNEGEPFEQTARRYKDAPGIENHLRRLLSPVAHFPKIDRIKKYLEILTSINPSWRDLIVKEIFQLKLYDVVRRLEEVLTEKEMKDYLSFKIKEYIDKDAKENDWYTLFTTFIESKKLNHNLVRRLMREYSPSAFRFLYEREKGMGSRSMEEEKMFKNKVKYNTDDIIYFINQLIHYSQFKLDDLLNMYKKSTPAAQAILRTVLFIPSNGYDKDFFILNQDLETIGMDDRPIQVDGRIPLIILDSLNHTDPEVRYKWATFFADYGIIPYFRYFDEEDS